MRSLLRKLGRLLRLGALVAVVIAVVRALVGRKQTEVTGEASWPPLTTSGPDSNTEPTPVSTRAATPDAESTAPSTGEPAADTGEASDGWVEPVGGTCPASHPIKGNAQSMIFHVPGGASYDRTVPERCYSSVEAAEADGFRAARR